MKSGVLATLIALLLVAAAVCARAEERSAIPNAPGSVIRAKSSSAPTTGSAGSSVVSPLDRVAHAVDGAESQVTKAAATDVGGGDRFDTDQNRAIGRAYLAQLYWRYQNWPDAIAAYNWGVGNLDTWVKAGRPADRFVNAVAVYLRRVLHDSGLCDSSASAPVRRASLKKSSPGQQTPQADAARERQSETVEQAACRDLDNWVSVPDGTGQLAFGFGPARFHSKLEKAMQLALVHLQPSITAMQRP